MEISAGTFQSKCFLYAWRHTDKLVVSDVDGTITKSDFLGHFLPMIGRDWTQLGVAELFTKIDQNGYKFIYLSARPISQSSTTRDFLGRIQQENHTLPDGPVILNPTSLLSALHREVITGKPEQFKIASLNEIKALFPENPFFAGYGNRINVRQCLSLFSHISKIWKTKKHFKDLNNFSKFQFDQFKRRTNGPTAQLAFQKFAYSQSTQKGNWKRKLNWNRESMKFWCRTIQIWHAWSMNSIHKWSITKKLKRCLAFSPPWLAKVFHRKPNHFNEYIK